MYDELTDSLASSEGDVTDEHCINALDCFKFRMSNNYLINAEFKRLNDITFFTNSMFVFIQKIQFFYRSPIIVPCFI